MTQQYDASWWEETWRKRMDAVTIAFGPLDPPGQVRSFHFPDRRLAVPGGCASAFRPAPDGVRLWTSLGLSQPLTAAASANPWEFGVYAPADSTWPPELLYDLVLGAARNPGWLSEGHCLPLTFYRGKDGQLDCGSFAATADPRIAPVGSLRSLYLWPDLRDPKQVKPAGEPFFIMCATGVTADEEAAADLASPPHLLLFLREMGVGQVTDPSRRSVFGRDGAWRAWEKIKSLSHRQVVDALGN